MNSLLKRHLRNMFFPSIPLALQPGETMIRFAYSPRHLRDVDAYAHLMDAFGKEITEKTEDERKQRRAEAETEFLKNWDLTHVFSYPKNT